MCLTGIIVKTTKGLYIVKMRRKGKPKCIVYKNHSCRLSMSYYFLIFWCYCLLIVFCMVRFRLRSAPPPTPPWGVLGSHQLVFEVFVSWKGVCGLVNRSYPFMVRESCRFFSLGINFDSFIRPSPRGWMFFCLFIRKPTRLYCLFSSVGYTYVFCLIRFRR